jgi:hypothetical protein
MWTDNGSTIIDMPRQKTGCINETKTLVFNRTNGLKQDIK